MTTRSATGGTTPGDATSGWRRVPHAAAGCAAAVVLAVVPTSSRAAAAVGLAGSVALAAASLALLRVTPASGTPSAPAEVTRDDEPEPEPEPVAVERRSPEAPPVLPGAVQCPSCGAFAALVSGDADRDGDADGVWACAACGDAHRYAAGETPVVIVRPWRLRPGR